MIPPQHYSEEMNVCETASHNVLKTVSKYAIPDILSGWTRFFRLERNNIDKKDLEEIYYRDWLYYASRSPIWQDRIAECNLNNIIDINDINDINDTDEESYQMFYYKYGLEPDEQPINVTYARIGDICNVAWESDTEFTKWEQCSSNNIIIL
jgi:hypothetical protein